MPNTASRQNRQARCPAPITKCRITPNKTNFLIQKIFYEYYNVSFYEYTHIPNQLTFGNQTQIYTETSFAPLITYGQSAFLNLLIFRIFNVKDVDILHSFLRFVPIIFPVVNIAVVNIAHIHLIFTKFVLYIHLIFT